MELFNEKEVQNEEKIKIFQKQQNLCYIAISAKKGINVKLVFQVLSEKCVKMIRKYKYKKKYIYKK